MLRHILGAAPLVLKGAGFTLINATLGFTKLSDIARRSAKSLMRMLGPRGNPQARNLFEIVAYLQQAEGVRFEVHSARRSRQVCGRRQARSEERSRPHGHDLRQRLRRQRRNGRER